MNPLGQLPYQANYDYDTGQPIETADITGQDTINNYGGSGYGMDRVMQVNYANGAHTYYSYPSTTEVVTQQDQNNSGDAALKSQTLYDELGRPAETDIFENSSQYIASQTQYDAIGLLYWASNPSRPGDGLGFQTVNTHDGLGRVTRTQTGDGAVSTISYSGSQQTVADQAGNSRTLTYDGLGRLTTVSDATGTTTYTYDPNGNLTRVAQGGETRTFAYDSLSRLLSATNPESGTVSYAYDWSDNVTSRTDARNVVTSYGYDALNRLTSKTYSDGAPAVTYTFATSGTATGHLVAVQNGSSVTNFTSFDQVGNVLASNQVTAGQTYSFAYNYDLAGALTSEVYPSGRVVNTTYDGAGRAETVTGALNGQSTGYVTTAAYYPHGGLWHYQDGNGVIPTWTYNSRLQMSAFWADLDYDPNRYLFYSALNWGGTNNNGNLQSMTTYAGGPGPLGALQQVNQSFGYDAVNRLTSISDSGYSRSFGYDQYGNMWVTGNSGVPLAGNTPTSNVYNGNNQIAGASYDAAGNQLSVNGDTLAYNAENLVKSATEPPSLGGATESYLYDGAGERVEKTGPGGTTVYVYDVFGKLAAEYSTAQNTSPCATCYLSYDHLGSIRMVTDQNANVVARHDYLPFGEEIPANTAGRNWQWGSTADVDTKFTGQIRDNETGMDYFNARYFTAPLERFNSPDPENAGADVADPQSWNAYSYVRNNPLSNVDPLGLWVWGSEGCYYDTVALYTDIGGGPQFAGYDTQPIGCTFITGGSWPFLGYIPTSANTGGGGGAQPPANPQPPKIDCSHALPMPPTPAGASVDANEQALQNEIQQGLDAAQFAAQAGQGYPTNGGLSWWLNRVRPGGAWDYKQQGAVYTPFGNFNFGATCNTLGLSLAGCYRGAGGEAYGTAASNVAFGSHKWTAGPGDPIGSPANDNGMPVYGDQATPIENQSVIAGYGYAAWQNVCNP